MTEADVDHLTRAQTELGEPEALFHISRGRFLTKLSVALLLVAYGIAANYVWWVHGPATFGHFELLLLVVVPLFGPALLWHMYRNRGLFVLVYPTGLLRLRRGEVDSFPWDEIDRVTIKVQRAEAALFSRGPDGSPTACWLPVHVPAVKIWEAGVSVYRQDGVAAHFGPVLTDYDLLAEEIQKRTFAALWPLVLGQFRAGRTVTFGDLEVTPAGLRHAGKFLRWRDLKELAVAQGKLTVKQAGKWLPWLVADITGVPNPHVLFALVEEARRTRRRPPKGEPHAAERDHRARE